MTSISTKAWRVTKVEEPDRITFDTMIEDIDMRQQMSGRQEVRYNSKTDPKPPPGYETAAASVGKLLTTITIDTSGKLLRREKKYQQDVDNLNVRSSWFRCLTRRWRSGNHGRFHWTLPWRSMVPKPEL